MGAYPTNGATMRLSEEEIRGLGLRRVGKDCVIHQTVQFFNPQSISIGDNVRIDCFSLISAGPKGVEIGSHVHIGAGCYFFGGGGRLVLEDFSGTSPRVSLFTASDDFIEGYLRGPRVPAKYKKVREGDVILRSNAGVAAGSIVLPGVSIGVNACVGAMTVVSRNIPDNGLFGGNPPKLVVCRDKDLCLRLSQEFLDEYAARGSLPKSNKLLSPRERFADRNPPETAGVLTSVADTA
jgi:galactoside O-acetyltransferase